MMARRIETGHGTLVGMVDRVERAVNWSLECPGCGREIPLSREQFTGQDDSPVVACACSYRERAPYDFAAAAFTPGPPTAATVEKVVHA